MRMRRLNKDGSRVNPRFSKKAKKSETGGAGGGGGY